MRRFLQFALALALLLSSVLLLAETSKRLVLKDGSYQPVSKWEVKGERVRYFSTERAEWEEVPVSLVDWPATEKWNSQRAALNADTAAATAEEKAEREAEAAKTPTIAPGITLPATGGVFVLDTYSGQQQLSELVQTSGAINKQTGKNILRAAINPVASAKQSIELKGARARVQVHVPQPEIYVDIDTDTQAQPLALTDHFRLVRLEQKKDMRVLGNVKIAFYGKVRQEQTFIPTRAEKVSGDWVKLLPTKPLTLGEYAVVEMLGEKEMNLYVWDFGFNPAAPENPSAWKPEPAKQRTYESPVLIPQKK
ncbi:MAG TPA: hypothetical protein VN622_15305 [Clostridia bacterium]|nr:hypothetical protein [Clostridia bacterium]